MKTYNELIREIQKLSGYEYDKFDAFMRAGYDSWVRNQQLFLEPEELQAGLDYVKTLTKSE